MNAIGFYKNLVNCHQLADQLIVGYLMLTVRKKFIKRVSWHITLFGKNKVSFGKLEFSAIFARIESLHVKFVRCKRLNRQVSIILPFVLITSMEQKVKGSTRFYERQRIVSPSLYEINFFEQNTGLSCQHAFMV